MTVAELIAALGRCDPAAVVVVPDGHGGMRDPEAPDASFAAVVTPSGAHIQYLTRPVGDPAAACEKARRRFCWSGELAVQDLIVLRPGRITPP